MKVHIEKQDNSAIYVYKEHIKVLREKRDALNAEIKQTKELLAELSQSNKQAGGQMKCQECGKEDKTVRMRTCGYNEEINGIEVWETVCDDCEHKHLMDI